MKKIKIIVACGASIAQSTMMQMAIIDAFKEKKIDMEIDKCTFSELQSKVANNKPDFVFTAGNPPFELPTDIIQYNGLPIITGFGKEKIFDEVFETIKKKFG